MRAGNLLDVARSNPARSACTSIGTTPATSSKPPSANCSANSPVTRSRSTSRPLHSRSPDFSLIQHALGNLLPNAATHTRRFAIDVGTGRCRPSLERGRPRYGIPAEWLPRIFDKFFRALARPRAVDSDSPL
jgi:K+-sensing histidine kinase KdpD